MAGYIIAEVDVHDAAGFEEYRKLVPGTFANYGGRFIVRGGKTEVLEGDWTPKRIVVLEFPDFSKARDWWASQEYLEPKKMRQRTARTNLILVDGYNPGALTAMTTPKTATARLRPGFTPHAFNTRSESYLPGLVGMEIVEVREGAVSSRLKIRPDLLAPNGFLHAATVIALADTSAAFGTMAHLPEGASGFTTIELKTNFLGTVLEGEIRCEATAVHLGRTTQVWDAVVSDAATGKTLALFRCSQMVLWPTPGKG